MKLAERIVDDGQAIVSRGRSLFHKEENVFAQRSLGQALYALNGTEIGNLILLSLLRRENTQVFASLELVRLKPQQVLHEAGDVIKSIYFMNNGLCSLLIVQPDGKTVEVGLIGNEGFVGIPVVFGFKTSPVRMVVQAETTAYRIEITTLLRLLPEFPGLEQQLQRFAMLLAMQSTQLAACNRLHDVEERLARRLLMTYERLGQTTIPLTQEFLGQMLGTRRSTVTVAAGILQKAGIISYTRGNVTIRDRSKLEQAACDCYKIIQEQKSKWQAEIQQAN